MKRSALKYVNTGVATALLSTTILLGGSNGASAESDISSQSSPSEIVIQDSVKNLVDSYVKIKEQKFVLENKDELLNKLGEKDFNIVVKQIEETNEFLGELDSSELRVEGNTFTGNLSDGEFSTMAHGVTKIKVYWSYARVYLSATTLRNLGAGLSLAGIWIPHAVASKVAGSLGVIIGLNTKDGIWFDYNFYTGVIGKKGKQ
ncbi:hypothetical protein P5663_09175 [Priestia flexa]|uniref:hypothetical protein n=1 Tax=Priestia flexa TaxID=86664 RepID=UPI00240E6BCD|nr:hypothetical protein [Priestia flexa]WEZ09990.1 hypothetical protein P5663_09175 [Priestia flexa]